MKKTLLTAAGMAVLLFLYGWAVTSESIPHPDIEIEHLHPMVVHFPVALFLTALALDILALAFKKEGLCQTARHIFICAALVTPLVAYTGMLEAHELNLHHPFLDKHAFFAHWTMWVALMSVPVLWFIHRELPKYFKVIFLIVLIATASLVSLTGDKGGHMVFEYGVGVEE